MADLYQELRDSALAIREKTLVVENVLELQLRLELGATEVDRDGNIIRENLAAYTGGCGL